MDTSKQLVYKTYQIETNKEHFAKPINLSGARTIKLTELPTGVKCWISTDTTGANLYPLINRGDGWVNLPFPLYDLYVYTKGTTISNEKIILNFTGEDDFFVYGNNSSERIDKVGMIEGFSDQAITDLNNAIFNTYTAQEPIIQFAIQGEFELGASAFNGKLAYLPYGTGDVISKFQLESNAYYRFNIFGHFDCGSKNRPANESANNSTMLAMNSHLCIFDLSNNATFTPFNTTGFGEKMYKIDKNPYSTPQGVFDITGIKYLSYTESAYPLCQIWQDYGLNFNDNNYILKGSILKKYKNIGIIWNINNGGNSLHNPSCHCSLLVTISRAFSNITKDQRSDLQKYLDSLKG